MSESLWDGSSGFDLGLNDFREDLPQDCPESVGGTEIVETRVLYRLVRSIPPKERDFDSESKKFPDRRYKGKECEASGLSVWDTLDAVKIQQRRFRGAMRILRMELGLGSGYIAKTFKNPAHWTWWPYADFDALNCGHEVEQ